ncbi:hypothetical protein [Mesorhizobium sophorae]|uniref:hypothetical protein n=1 Tax=Mesorhizobium sophorae TaxID=1300294 RepID=UPI000BA3F52D|nr:hypothetical protein [Mesorhizobium sophorae]
MRGRSAGCASVALRAPVGASRALIPNQIRSSASFSTTPSRIPHQFPLGAIYTRFSTAIDTARRGKADAQFTDLRVIYLVKQYGLRSRYDRLRERGMLTKAEACAKLGITECTLVRWAKYDIVKRHAYNGYIGLYELPGPHVPAKQCSRWNQLAHRAEAIRRLNSSKCSDLKERAVV